MNKRICLIILLVTFKICNAQNVFQKAIYGMSLYQSITKPTSDGGYILTGENYSPSQDEDVFLIKMDANGDTMWTRTYPIPGNDGGEDVIQTIDGGFFVVAWGFIMKTDSVGHPIWAKKIYSNWSAIHRSATEDPNGNILIVSRGYDLSIQTSRIILTKLDSSGNLLFMKAFGNFLNPYPYCVRITSDGGYIIAGETAYASSATDAILIKTDSLGNLMWARQYGGNSYDLFRSVEQTSNGDYLALGTTSPNIGSFHVKVDSAGALIWARTYTGSGNSCSFGMITKTSDQNFVFCDDYATIAKMNSDGVILWAKSYKPGAVSNGKRFNSIKETPDGGLIASGYYIEVTWNGFLYLVKSNSNEPNPCFASNVSLSPVTVQSKDSLINCTVTTGSIYNLSVTAECLCDTSNFLCTTVIGISEDELTNYPAILPNPFSDKIEINYENNKEIEMILFDISGRKVIHQKFSKSVSINTEQLGKGVYIYEIRDDNNIFKKGKIVKN